MGATQQYEAICALSHSAYAVRTLGYWCVLSDIVAGGQLHGLRSAYAVVDDFGSLAELPPDHHLQAVRFFNEDLPNDAEQAAYRQFYSPTTPLVEPSPATPLPRPRGVVVRIEPAPADCVIRYEAEIDVQRADRIHPADRLFALRIGGDDPVWVNDTELRALVVAAAELLNLSIRGKGVAA